jgi:transposase
MDLERRRQKAAAMKESGLSTVEIARRLNTTQRSVRRWLRIYRHVGLTGLARKASPGRPSYLTSRQRRALVNCLLRGASHYGFGTDLWTCPRIAQLIADRYRASYHVDAIPRVMAGLGFSPSKTTVSWERTG